jgi:hypothetical protein
LLAALVGVLAVTAACTNKTDAGPAGCDPTQCAAKNECLPDATGANIQCRLPCTAHTDCPFNTYCTPGSPKNYCVRTTVAIPQQSGQWGTSCVPSEGYIPNPACDIDDGFACHATGTTDALAYCTLFDCQADTDCAGGYYCATINEAPNAHTDKRSFGKTRAVCLKRAYCSPCAADFDCPIIDGTQSRCATDDVGGKYCATVCDTTSNCPLDASCNGVTDDGTAKVCKPHAGTCKGDGSLCSPCGSDADCPDGFCLKGGYNSERFCSVKSTSVCDADHKGTCPAFTGYAKTVVACQTTDDPNIPKDQCIGVIPFSDTGDIGCYTKH